MSGTTSGSLIPEWAIPKPMTLVTRGRRRLRRTRIGGGKTLDATSNDGGKSEYARWLDAFEMAYENAKSPPSGSCPHCGWLQLRLVFLVDREGSRRGTAVFWCAHCLRGLIPLRSVIPDGAQTVLRGTE